MHLSTDVLNAQILIYKLFIKSSLTVCWFENIFIFLLVYTFPLLRRIVNLRLWVKEQTELKTYNLNLFSRRSRTTGCEIFRILIGAPLDTFWNWTVIGITNCDIIRSNIVVHANTFFFLFGFYFTNIHDSQDSRGRGRLSL